MVTAKSAMENFVIDRIDYGTVTVRPMQTVAPGTGGVFVPGPEERFGYAYVECHSNTGSRYVVVATPLGSSAAMREGGDIVVSLLSPWNTTYPMNPLGKLTCSYVAEKFAHPVHRWQPCDLVCVTHTIGLALGIETDVETAHEYLEKE